MPLKYIASPKADSVGSLISPSRDPFQVDKWKAEELARRREQYSQELRAQIQERGTARMREKASSPRFAQDGFSSLTMPTSSHFGSIDPRYSAEIAGFETLSTGLPFNDADIQDRMAMALPRAPPPVLTGKAEATAPLNGQQMSEKDRFIASMELGITHTPTYVHRSVTLPAPAAPSTARAAVPGATPVARSRTAEEEDAENLRRQQSFKADLEMQIQEKKRRKALELERERQWEAEQEARLEKEREELRKEFEAEHAARRAKFEADAAENAATVAASRKATDNNASKDSDDGVKIYAPRRNISNKSKPPCSLLEAGTADEEEHPPRPPQRENDSSSSIVLAPNELSRKLQQTQKREDKARIEDQPPPRRCNSNNTPKVEATPAAAAAQTAALTEQVEELKRLNEALQRDLSLHKTVLDLVKDTKLATLAAAMPPPPPLPQQQQPPIYINPLSLGFPALGSVQPPTALLNSISVQAPTRSLPILYTAAELRTEDSRPPTTAKAVMKPTSKLKPTPTRAPSTTGYADKINYRKDVKDVNNHNDMIKAVRPVQRSSISSLGTAPSRLVVTSETSQKVPVPTEVVAKAQAPFAASGVTLSALETARLPPARAAERLGIWKKAKLKLRKLGAKEAVCVLKEESSAAMGPLQ